MKFANILVGGVDEVPLEDFVKSVSLVLNVDYYEIRDSDNYEDGYYIVASSRSMKLKFMFSDEHNRIYMPYRLRIGSIDNTPITYSEINMLARELVAKGYKVERLMNAGKKDEQRIPYPWPSG